MACVCLHVCLDVCVCVCVCVCVRRREVLERDKRLAVLIESSFIKYETRISCGINIDTVDMEQPSCKWPFC